MNKDTLVLMELFGDSCYSEGMKIAKEAEDKEKGKIIGAILIGISVAISSTLAKVYASPNKYSIKSEDALVSAEVCEKDELEKENYATMHRSQ